ncbi:MAG: MBL fold metallo-hydrolase [Ruminococcaceae bacterium]|nr:MBL fold metallo-hydrolase [Oscillospiraceae bacterium]
MKTVRIPAEGYGANCWVIIDEESGEFALIDPSPTGKSFLGFLEKRGMDKKDLKYILLTHGHFDHITGADEIRDATGAPLCVHEADSDCLYDPDKNAYKYFFREDLILRPAEIILRDGDALRLGNNEIKVMHTPGHTKGSVCYFTGDSIYTGDTLFDRSIGRTDLFGGSMFEIENSLRALCALEHDYNIYPGHGSVSTLFKQIKFNPYLYGGNL